MSKTAKRVLIYALALLFLAGGSYAVLFAQGYRLDLATFGLKKVGALFIRTFPDDAKITLDAKIIKKDWSIFQSGTFVNGLFPQTYTLSVSAPGYQTLERSLHIEPGDVVELKSTVLVPGAPKAIVSGAIADFRLIGGEPLLRNASGTLLYKNQKLKGNEIIGVLPSGKRLLTQDSKTSAYFLNDLENATSTNLSALVRKLRTESGAPDEFLIDAAGDATVLVSNREGLSLLDVQKNTLITVATSTGDHVFATRFWIAWTKFNPSSSTTDLIIYDRFAGSSKTEATIPGNVTRLAEFDGNRIGMLSANGLLYAYDTGALRLDRIASDVRLFSVTSDGSLLAVAGNDSLQVIPQKGQPGYARFALADARAVERIEWYRDGEHLFLYYPDKIVFMDIQDRLQQDSTMVAHTGNGAYDGAANALYFLDKEKLFRFDFPK